MNVTILPGTLKGAVTPPSSKSQTHRAVLALMLAQGEGKLSNLAVSQDIQATQDCVAALKSGQPHRRMGCLCWTAASRAPPCAFSSRWLWLCGVEATLPAGDG